MRSPVGSRHVIPTSHRSRLVTKAALAATTGALLLAGILPAAAADTGPLQSVVNGNDPSETTGTNFDTVQVAAPESCRAAATRHVLQITQVVAARPADRKRASEWVGDNLYSPVGVGLPGPLTVKSSNSWQGWADVYGQTLVPGEYRFVLRCQNDLGTARFEEWSGGVTFSKPTAWAANRAPISNATTTPTAAPSTSSSTSPSGSASGSPSGSPSGSASGSTSVLASGGDSVDREDGLAATGAGVTGLAVLAVLLLVGGAGLAALARRRRTSPTPVCRR